MDWIDKIWSFIYEISEWFYEARLTSESWVWPFNQIAYVFGWIEYYTFHLLTPIAQFGDWARNVQTLVGNILDIDTIKELLKQWLDWAADAWEWVSDAWYYVTGWIGDWWLYTQTTVKGWISVATQGFNDLAAAWNNFWKITWPQWVSSFDSLAAAWDDFWVNTFPSLVSFTWLTTWWNDRVRDVSSLIESAFKLRESWWQGWQEIREQVFDFFSDPLEFVWERFADWFLGPEE